MTPKKIQPLDPASILEGNKLIADFDGKKWTDDKNEFMRSDEDLLFPESLYYHLSWYWLMPVVGKIEDCWNPLSDRCVYDESEISRFEIITTGCWVYSSGYKNGKYLKFDAFYDLEGNVVTKLQAVWLAVVDFIKWFNQTIKNNE
jgi:hypothetical protein